MENLKACPFCGVQGELDSYEDINETQFLVACENDDCKFTVHLSKACTTEKEAIEIWNRGIK